MLTVFLLICTSSFALTSASAAQSSVLVKDDSTVAVVLSSDNIGADSTDHTFTAVKIMDLYKIDGVDATAYQYKLVLDEALATSSDFGTLLSQCALNALAIDNPLEYARLVLDSEMQAWVNAEDNLEVW